jgi:hypothetical protein
VQRASPGTIRAVVRAFDLTPDRSLPAASRFSRDPGRKGSGRVGKTYVR